VNVHRQHTQVFLLYSNHDADAACGANQNRTRARRNWPATATAGQAAFCLSLITKQDEAAALRYIPPCLAAHGTAPSNFFFYVYHNVSNPK
jgi:hypothetical protein